MKLQNTNKSAKTNTIIIVTPWNWTRHTFTKDSKYITYVKPVKVKGELNKSTAAQELGLEVK